MPIKASAQKERRKTIKRTAHNRSYLKQVKDTVKNLHKAVTAKKADEVKALTAKAIKLIDQAAQKNMIHKNNAARKKSRLLAAIKKSL